MNLAKQRPTFILNSYNRLFYLWVLVYLHLLAAGTAQPEQAVSSNLNTGLYLAKYQGFGGNGKSARTNQRLWKNKKA